MTVLCADKILAGRRQTDGGNVIVRVAIDGPLQPDQPDVVREANGRIELEVLMLKQEIKLHDIFVSPLYNSRLL